MTDRKTRDQNMLEILQAGPLVSVQDLGRSGFRHQGVSRAGALDCLSLRIANRLVGNPDNTAGLEMVFGNTRVRFVKETWFALTGSECFSTLNGEPVLLGWTRYARAGDELIINMPRSGLCSYLAVDGGIDVPVLMDARATDVQSGFGGWQGRKLEAGDRLPVGKQNPEQRKSHGILLPVLNQEIHVLAGPEVDQFDAEAQNAFFSHGWKVKTDSNRMGFRLEGDTLVRQETVDLLSHGVFPGVIQVPPNGQPIILAAEAQSTGGYPRIACVIQSDLWKLGQLRPGTFVHFKKVSRTEAAERKQHQELYLERILLALAEGY